MSNLSLQARVFYLIRFHDVELAEDFLRRCPEVNSIEALNHFFHLQMSQYAFNTQQVRMGLVDCDRFEQWSHLFIKEVLPSLMSWRFPPFTQLNTASVYDGHTDSHTSDKLLSIV